MMPDSAATFELQLGNNSTLRVGLTDPSVKLPAEAHVNKAGGHRKYSKYVAYHSRSPLFPGATLPFAPCHCPAITQTSSTLRKTAAMRPNGLSLQLLIRLPDLSSMPVAPSCLSSVIYAYSRRKGESSSQEDVSMALVNCGLFGSAAKRNEELLKALETRGESSRPRARTQPRGAGW
jgi:hypothetical protein